MNRWFVSAILAIFALKLVSGGIMMSSPHGMDMDACEGIMCGITADQCLAHCLAVGQTNMILPAMTPAVFLLVVSVLVTLFAAVSLTARSRAYATGLAPPGLVFVRNTILRE